MLFMIYYTVHDGRTSSARFTQWEPPITFVSHYSGADGRRGWAVVETDSAAKLLAATATYEDVIEFDVTPIIDIQEAIPIFLQSYEWADTTDEEMMGDEEDEE